jgi:hypothetical protein
MIYLLSSMICLFFAAGIGFWIFYRWLNSLKSEIDPLLYKLRIMKAVQLVINQCYIMSIACNLSGITVLTTVLLSMFDVI